MPDNFSIEVPVKPYVKAYLENNCGSPVDLSMLQVVYVDFINYIKNPTLRTEATLVCNYTTAVKIIIPKDVFYRYGWELTKTDIIKLNNKIEGLVKFASRNFITTNKALGVPVAASIREFQILFSFTEDSFPFETIKKDFDRHGNTVEMKIFRDFRAEITNIFLASLSDLGTVSKKFKNERYQHSIRA